MREVDGQGNVKVFTFTVHFEDGDEMNAAFDDYAVGWDWARATQAEAHDYGDSKVDVDWAWMASVKPCKRMAKT